MADFLNLPNKEEQVNQNAILQNIATSLGVTSGALKSAIDVANASAVNANAKIIDVENRFQQLTSQQQQDAEVVSARQSTSKNKTFTSLDARMEEDENDLKTHKAENVQRFENIEQQLEYGTAGIDDSVVSDSKVWSSAKTQEQIQTAVEIFPGVFVSLTEPPDLKNGDIWVKPIVTEDVLPSDYFMRFDAMELDLASGEKVAEWQDLSGNGNHVSQSNNSRSPTFYSTAFNGKPSVRFDRANNHLMDRDNFNLDRVNGATVFVVGQLENEVTSEAFINIGNEGTDQNSARKYVIKTSNSAKAFQTQINGGTARGSAPADLSPFLLSSAWDGSVNKVYKNGEFATESSYVGSIEGHNKVRIGNNLYTTNPERLDGLISEIIYFSRGLNEQEMSFMHNYLMDKWGL